MIPKERLIEGIRKAYGALEEKDKAREEMLKVAREIIRSARRLVACSHVGNRDEASKLVKELVGLVNGLNEYKLSHPDLYYSGFVQNALVEYVEARLLYSFAFGSEAPCFEELQVDPASYLLGVADLTGELRRLLSKYIKADDYGSAEEIVAIMEYIFDELRGIALPDALAPGLRRKVDVMRGVLEGARRDLLFYKRSHELLKAMSSEGEV